MNQMKQIERQDIKTMIDRLLQIDVETYTKLDSDAVDRAIQMFEDLGNLVGTLRQENTKLKQDILQGSASGDAALQLEAMIED